MAMTTMTMPGFNAEASLYKRDFFTKTKHVVLNDTNQSVQPAGICYSLGQAWEAAFERDDGVWQLFFGQLANHIGCP
jgi:hypothetical protein